MDTQILSLENLSGEYITEKDWLFEKFLNRLGSLKHLCLSANQGWGLQDYMKELGFQLREKNPDIHICFIDMKPANSISSFLEHFTATLMQRFPDTTSGIRVESKDLNSLKLPAIIAKKKKIKIAVIVANSHLFSRFKNPDPFLISLYLKLRNQKNCVFCFYGNNTPFFRALIFHPGPLSRFGRAYELTYSPFNCRSTYIRKVFHDQGKNIGFNTSIQMSSMVNNHPIYLKILVWHALIRTQNTCTLSIVRKAMNDMIFHYDFFFHTIMEQLTPNQISLLKALEDGNQKLYSKEIREKYQLGSSSNVAKIKRGLQLKHILDAGNREVEVSDPIFQLWLHLHYFR